jgi:PAS domain S-box-containing protein
VEPATTEGRLYETAPCGLLQLDADFRIVRANRYFETLVGVGQGELVGRTFHSLLSLAGRVYLQTRVQQELALSGRMEELVLDMVAADGTRTPVMLNLVQTSGEGGLPEIHMAVGRAAAKRAYEAEVPKARQAAQQALQVKADFLANISHEMRTPLNGVVGMASVLSASRLSTEQHQMVEVIQKSGEMLARLVEDLLDLSNVRTGQLGLTPRAFQLNEALSGLLASTRLAAQSRGLTFVAPDLGSDEWYMGDPVRVKQIVEALLSNAVKFTPSGSVRLDVNHEADGLRLTVADTGVGFDEALTERIFEPFGQAGQGLKREFAGAGLGLSIARGLAELMQGQISCVSEPGRGSQFSVYLPLQRLPSPKKTGASETGDRPLRVLLVEDNPTNQQVVQLILGALQVELVIADNGQIGLDEWSKHAFDLVLMDIQMPVMDGLTAIREIRLSESKDLRLGRTPIIVLSANAMDQHRQEAEAAGADAYLSKPVAADVLINGISDVLSRMAADETRAEPEREPAHNPG